MCSTCDLANAGLDGLKAAIAWRSVIPLSSAHAPIKDGSQRPLVTPTQLSCRSEPRRGSCLFRTGRPSLDRSGMRLAWHIRTTLNLNERNRLIWSIA